MGRLCGGDEWCVGRGCVSGDRGGGTGRCCVWGWVLCRTFAWIVRRGDGGGFTGGLGRRVIEGAVGAGRLALVMCNGGIV
jgi:hypothetical protein